MRSNSPRGAQWSDTELVLNRVADQLTRLVGPGDIVLLHDDHRHMLVLLNCLRPVLSERGDDLLSGVHPIE